MSSQNGQEYRVPIGLEVIMWSKFCPSIGSERLWTFHQVNPLRNKLGLGLWLGDIDIRRYGLGDIRRYNSKRSLYCDPPAPQIMDFHCSHVVVSANFFLKIFYCNICWTFSNYCFKCCIKQFNWMLQFTLSISPSQGPAPSLFLRGFTWWNVHNLSNPIEGQNFDHVKTSRLIGTWNSTQF